jgi:CHAT domain-containing protein
MALDALLEANDLVSSPEARFDAALLLEQIPMPHEAREQWRQAVHDETMRGWRDESASHLAAVEQRIERRNGLLKEISDRPESLLSENSHLAGAMEDAMSAALATWLPHRDDESARKNLFRLATLLQERSADRWLADLLALPESPEANRAERALAEAWKANSAGENVQAGEKAQIAERLFTALGSPAGKMRAHLEYVYSLHRRAQAAPCLEALQGFRANAARRSYVWLEGQAWLDEITCRTQTRTEDVIPECQRAYQWIGTTGYDGLRLRALGFLTQRYYSFGSPLKQWSLGRDGLAAYWESVLPGLRAHNFYYSLATAAQGWNTYRTEAALIRESVQALAAGPDRKLLALMLSNLGAAEARAGSHLEAASALSRAAVLFSELNPRESAGFRLEAEVARAHSELLAGHAETALHRLEQAAAGEKLPYAGLSFPERVKFLPAIGDALLATGRFPEAAVHFQQAVDQTVNQLRPVANHLQRANALRETEAAWRGLCETKLRLGDPAGALAVWIALHDERFANTAFSPVHIPDGTALLSYVYLPGGLSAWVADSRGVEQRWIPPREVTRVAERMAALSADAASPLDAVQAAARQLHHILIVPFEHRLSQSHTIFVDADGPLTQTPWLALEDETGRPLIDGHAVVQAAGWSAGERRSMSHPVPGNQALILSDPAFGLDLAEVYPPLTDAAEEARALSSQIPGATLLEGAKASAGEFLRLAPAARLLHFAGHGIGNGGFGALLLAGDSEGSSGRVLSAQEISRLNLRQMDLAVLAACSSGVGEQTGVVNLDSLVTAFLDAGTEQVLATRWNVTSRPTAHLMSSFYGALLQGALPSEALRRAALRVRGDPATAHPYYWAAFQLFGTP